MVESKTADTDGKGIPLKSSYPANIPVPVLYTILNGVFLAIGVAVAYFMILPSTPAANVKIQLLASHDLGWIYMGAYALKVGQVMMNTNLGIRRKACKVNVPDQQACCLALFVVSRIHAGIQGEGCWWVLAGLRVDGK